MKYEGHLSSSARKAAGAFVLIGQWVMAMDGSRSML
jgi:hypothetical protein